MLTQLENAISDLADYAVSGLAGGVICDSPVRSNGRLSTIPRVELESLKAELARLRAQQGEDLVRAADGAEDKSEKINLLRQAVDIAPANFDAHLRLVILLREKGDYSASERELRFATRIREKSADAWRELGATQSES